MQCTYQAGRAVVLNKVATLDEWDIGLVAHTLAATVATDAINMCKSAVHTCMNRGWMGHIP